MLVQIKKVAANKKKLLQIKKVAANKNKSHAWQDKRHGN